MTVVEIVLTIISCIGIGWSFGIWTGIWMETRALDKEIKEYESKHTRY